MYRPTAKIDIDFAQYYFRHYLYFGRAYHFIRCSLLLTPDRLLFPKTRSFRAFRHALGRTHAFQLLRIIIYLLYF